MVERVGAKASAPDTRRTAPRAIFAMEAAISRDVKVDNDFESRLSTLAT